jgi:hypothetical protein
MTEKFSNVRMRWSSRYRELLGLQKDKTRKQLSKIILS